MKRSVSDAVSSISRIDSRTTELIGRNKIKRIQDREVSLILRLSLHSLAAILVSSLDLGNEW
jgi:hypothetical protein